MPLRKSKLRFAIPLEELVALQKNYADYSLDCDERIAAREMSCGQSLSVLWLWQLKLASAMIQCNCIHHPCTIRCRLALFGTLDTNVSARIWFATTTKLFHITSSNKKKYRISASNNFEWINGLSHFTRPFILAISQTFTDVVHWLRFFGKLFRNGNNTIFTSKHGQICTVLENCYQQSTWRNIQKMKKTKSIIRLPKQL